MCHASGSLCLKAKHQFQVVADLVTVAAAAEAAVRPVDVEVTAAVAAEEVAEVQAQAVPRVERR